MLLTESILLATPTFLAFCEAWEADKRCPVGLIDWLLDLDNEAMALAAKWAYETNALGGYISPLHLDEKYEKWGWISIVTGAGWYCNVPCFHDSKVRLRQFFIFPAAIAWFLCNFDASKLPAETIST